MADIKIATDYLQDLFEKLADGRQDPARVDRPFADEAWRAVRGEIEQLRGERDALMTPVCRFCGEPAEGLYRMSHGCVCYPADRAQWLCAQHTARAEPLQGMELIGIGVEAWRAVCGEIERLRGECQRFNQELGYLRHRLHASERVAEAKSLRVADLLAERDELLDALRPFAEYAKGPLKNAIAPDFHRAAEVLARPKGPVEERGDAGPL